MGLTPVIDAKLENGLYVPREVLERPQPQRSMDPMIGLDQWIQYFNFGGFAYPFWPRQTLLGQRQEWPDFTFEGYIQGIFKANGPVFTCMLVRMMLFSEARFQFRQLNNGRPGELYGTKDLDILETPWPNGTTGDLLSRAIQDADIAGNFFCTRRGGYLYRLRPDWVTIVAGSPNEAPAAIESDPYNFAMDTQVIGYLYQPGGPSSGHEPQVLLPEEVCHWAPIPDPIYRFRGMSWITPVIREVLADNAATSHKLKFFENGATVNMVVSLDPDLTEDSFDKWVEKYQEKHEGVLNAYKTLVLGGGAQVTPVGATPEQIDFQVTQGAGETRIANAAGLPPVICGFSEGLRSATYSNYKEARRHAADATFRPLWRNFASSMQTLVPPPHGNSELWYDDRDIAFLRIDRTEVATILQAQSATISSLISAGYEPDAAVQAVMADDLGLLKGRHTGLFSVQLQPPMPNGPTANDPTEPVPTPPTPESAPPTPAAA